MISARVRACCAAGVLGIAQAGSPGGSDPVSLRDLVADSLLQRSLHRRVVTHRLDPDGAAGVNREHSSRWFIEEQRVGADFVQRGTAVGRMEWIGVGWRILDWGIARQGPAGDFPGTGDAFHSTSFFVEALARALLLDTSAATPTRVGALTRAAEWLLQPEVAARGQVHNRPYSHRRWILAAAHGLTARVTGDARFWSAARSYAADGLGLQTGSGVNPEQGGADVGYQMVGVLMASRYVAAGPDPAMRDAVVSMLDRASRWAASRIRADGTVDARGSTRTLREPARDGRIKRIPYHVLVEGFAYAARLTKDRSFEAAAERVARRRGWVS
jgi:hypothetical protein